MKRKNLAKKLTAMLMTGAMVMSMGMTAFAVEGDGDGNTSAAGSESDNNTGVISSESGLTSIDLTKIITADTNSKNDSEYVPNYTFTFSIEGTDDYINLKPDTNPANEDFPVCNGADVTGGISSTVSVPFDPTDDTKGKTMNGTGQITLDPSAFTTPGIYRYKVTEDDVSYDGVEKDSTEYYLDVYVIDKNAAVEGENYEYEAMIPYVVVSKHEVVNGKDELKKAELEFNNVYTTNELTVTKAVTGNQGNKTKEFNFVVTINAAGGADERYNVYVDNVLQTAGVEYNNGTATIETKLTDNGTIKITGLSANDSYTIVEDSYKADGYTTTISGADEISKTGEEEDYSAITDDNKEGRFAQGYMKSGDTAADKNVVYTNNKDVTTPTGIAMTFAPYIAMVAFAGVFAVMFLRKKREDF